jgi:hypothetical protein
VSVGEESGGIWDVIRKSVTGMNVGAVDAHVCGNLRIKTDVFT